MISVVGWARSDSTTGESTRMSNGDSPVGVDTATEMATVDLAAPTDVNVVGLDVVDDDCPIADTDVLDVVEVVPEHAESARTEPRLPVACAGFVLLPWGAAGFGWLDSRRSSWVSTATRCSHASSTLLAG